MRGCLALLALGLLTLLLLGSGGSGLTLLLLLSGYRSSAELRDVLFCSKALFGCVGVELVALLFGELFGRETPFGGLVGHLLLELLHCGQLLGAWLAGSRHFGGLVRCGGSEGKKKERKIEAVEMWPVPIHGSERQLFCRLSPTPMTIT